MFVGFNVAFFPMHCSGLQGMPRRVYTYQAGMGWDNLNLLSTVGALTLAAGILLTLVNAVRSAQARPAGGPDPWGAGTLEWATASPPRPCQLPAHPGGARARSAVAGVPRRRADHVAGLSAESREQLVTTVADARPGQPHAVPDATPWPFLAAVATTIFFIGSIFTPWAVVWGTVPVAITLTCLVLAEPRVAAKALALEKAP
jgi:cytochrome c oxidase subunit I+III